MNEGESILNRLYEFILTHQSLCSFRVQLLPMQSLDGDFSQMLLHAKVDQLVVLDDSVVVVVVSEYVFDEIVDLIFLLIENLDQEILDLSLLKLHVGVYIKFYDLLIDDLSNDKRKLEGFELEFLLPDSFALVYSLGKLGRWF